MKCIAISGETLQGHKNILSLNFDTSSASFTRVTTEYTIAWQYTSICWFYLSPKPFNKFG
jgi:hypothetical protein